MSGDMSSNQTGIYGQKGVAAASNVPGARRNAIGWYDSLREEFWLFGGQTDGSGTLGAQIYLVYYHYSKQSTKFSDRNV